ncbi:hypothetical protein NDI49_32250 [Trichocoleus sp. ST-U3]
MGVLSSDRTGSITNSGEILIGNDNPWYVQAQSDLIFAIGWLAGGAVRDRVWRSLTFTGRTRTKNDGSNSNSQG